MPLAVISRARFLILYVLQTLQPLLLQVQGNMVTVNETTLLAWQTLLTDVVTQLNALPVPAIFPAPRWAQLVGMAISHVRSANEILAAIPVAQLRIFPPRPGQGTTTVEMLRQVQSSLTRAAQALEAAEREIGGA